MLKYWQNLLLICKRIWQTKRSLRGRFVVYILALLLLFVSSLLSLLNIFGLLQPLNHDLNSFLSYELEARTADLDRQMDSLAAHSTDLSQQLALIIEKTLSANNINPNSDITSISNNPQLLTAIQREAYSTLTAKMQQTPASGALYLVNASVNTSLNRRSYNGLFLKFTNIHSENTLFNEICMFRGNPDIARENKISLYSTWQLELDVHAFWQAEQLMQNAGASDKQNYLLTDITNLRESWEQSRLFLMPIYGSNGNMLGLCGFEISNVYFQQRTRSSSYNGYPVVIAILDQKPDGTYEGQLSTPGAISGKIKLLQEGDYEHFTVGNDSYIGRTTPLDIGSSNHRLAVLMPEVSYNALLRTSRIRLALILSAVLLISLLFCYFFSKKYVEPIINDLKQLQQNPSAPLQSSVMEINQFFEFLQNRHAQQEEHLQQLVEQRTAAQQQYGLAAKHLQDAAAKQQALEEQYAKLKDQLQALQAERDQAQKEKDAAEQQLNFAQSALERVVEKKLQTVDPDNYQLFVNNLSTLTRKEQEIFNLYVQGCSTKEIISTQQISENTLKYHNKNIYSKLGVKTRKELLQYIELMRNIKE